MVAAAVQPDLAQDLVDPVIANPGHAGQYSQGLPSRNARVETRRLHQRADAVDDIRQPVLAIRSEQAAVARAGPRQTQDAPNGCRLARPVRSQEPEHTADRYGQIHPVDGRDPFTQQPAVLLTESFDL